MPKYDEEDDRPHRKTKASGIEDDEDDRPLRKKETTARGIPVWVYAVSGGSLFLLIIVALVGGYLLFAKRGSDKLLGPPPPPGFNIAGDSSIGMQVFLPGPLS